MWRRIFGWWRRARGVEDIEEELRAHLAIEARQQLEAHGSPEEAGLAARRAFGNLARIAEETRDVYRTRWLEELRLDLRDATRSLRARPGFATVAILTLTLGIGATTAVFSIVDAVLLRPLPYKDPDRLVAIWGRGIRDTSLSKIFLDWPAFDEFQRKAQTLESVSAATWANGLASHIFSTNAGPAREILALPVSASFFKTLGVTAALGRTFDPAQHEGGCSVMLANGFWNATFAADPEIAGKTITLDQRPCTIQGVMPPGFSFFPKGTDAWIRIEPGMQPEVGIFARLKPGVTFAGAQRELAVLHRAIHPEGVWHDIEPAVYDLHGEFTFLASRTLRTTLIVAFAAVALVLLIACLNVANLLLARLSDRQRELAVRAALGSGRGRLARQVLTEALLLSLLGTGLGIALAFAAVRYFEWASPIELTASATVGIDPQVLLFAVGLSIATTLAFGLLPAVRASRVDVIQRLKAAGRGAVSGPARHGMAKAAIAVQMALSCVLLIAAGLLMNSALRMSAEQLGFEPAHLFATGVRLPAARYSNEEQRLAFYDRLEDTLRGTAGVTGIALASKVPPNAGGNQEIEIQGQPAEPGTRPHDLGADAVSPAFFDLMRIPLLGGRGFDARDRRTSEPVAIVNQALVAEYFPDRDAIGERIRIADLSGNQRMPWLRIVGVVGNLKHTQLMNEMSWVETPILYRPLAQEAARRAIGIVVRTAGDAPSLSREIANRVASMDTAVPVAGLESVQVSVSKIMAYPNFRAVVLGFFALSALLLSAVGLHGVITQWVARRTSEFGLRRAVGAQSGDLLLLIARQAGTPVLAGLLCGLLCTVAFSRVLANLLYGIQPVDAVVPGSVSLVLLAAAALAVARPALRAIRVQPMVALRDE